MPKLGLQLYSLRDLSSKDFIGTLRKVADIGYEGIEFAGYGGLSARQLKSVLDDLGLQPVSSHVQLVELESNLDAVMEYGQELGLQYVVCPFISEDRRRNIKDYRKVFESLNRIGEKVTEAGLKFAYHNHAFEFEKQDGAYILDMLYEATNRRYVGAELDVYWIEYAGESAVDYIHKYADRSGLIHVKDMTHDEERFFAEVGYGRMDIPRMLDAAAEGGITWYLVEQDQSRRDPLESVKMSFQYLSNFLSTRSSK